MSAKPTPPARPVRCAIYTRKSTDEGLEKEFNSLDAQREAGEAYIKSQTHEGWLCLPTRYDDGGFSGGNLDRPALQRLLTDVRAGQVDVILIYKIDRLSRSLLDFAKLMEVFDEHQVAFVSITQLVNSATSMGRLMLNVLLSFAQFEREIIAERTRDKIAAARRKGKWSGGMPLLGYDVDPQGGKLLVNAAEAMRVRAIFELYLKHGALLPVVQELERRGWRTKRWTTRAGTTRGGVAFTRTNLYHLLTRVTHVGRIQYKTETHPGEHAAIVDAAVWEQAQALLRQHGRRDPQRRSSNALLQQLLRCQGCGACMSPTFCLKKATTRYRYYRCVGATKRGPKTCLAKALPAAAIEQFVLAQLRSLLADPTRLRQMHAALPPLGDDEPSARANAAELQRVVDPAWERLAAAEQAAIIGGWVERINYDGQHGQVTITFQRQAIAALAAEEDQACRR